MVFSLKIFSNYYFFNNRFILSQMLIHEILYYSSHKTMFFNRYDAKSKVCHENFRESRKNKNI